MRLSSFAQASASILPVLAHLRPTCAADLHGCVLGALTAGDATSRVVTSSNDTYTDARLGEKIQFDQFPTLIAYAVEEDEVSGLVKCAKNNGIKAVPRSGGHHFEAYSSLNNTLVIDISHLNSVNVSSDHSTAAVGAGIRLGALYTALDAYNTTFVGGLCPTVGLGGLLTAGGFNMQMRALGLSADHVKSATVVLADGSKVTASATSHSDLFWALRGGGGGTYGIATAFELELRQFPRSAMVAATWNDTDARFDVAKRFLEWAPRQPKEFTSQVNVYKSYVQVLGMYLGGSAAELQALLNSSGLLAIGSPQVQVSGGCDTDNARIFGYVTTECLPDDKVDSTMLNVVPESFSQFEDYPQFHYDEVPMSSERTTASPWARFYRISKSFFVQKDNLLSDEVLKGVVDRIGQLDDESQVWGEWHAWNLTSDGSNPDNAFAWRDQAYAHLEFQIHGSNDTSQQAVYEKWMADLESYLRPAVGPASYAGYVDSAISTNPLESYFGNNVCKLVDIKKTYDPENFFTNPDAVPPTAPSDIKC